MSDTIQDFKKYTLKKIVEVIAQNEKESRRNWILWLFKKEDGIWFWEAGFHPEEVRKKDFFDSKVNYIPFNPVGAMIVEKEAAYFWSRCGDFYGNSKRALELTVL